jgi:sec-independent protein translocase protein TatB
MFSSIGFLEILLITGVALMVLGPEKFPEFAKIAMRGVRDVRKYMTEAQREITKELNPLKDELQDITRMNPESYLDDILKEDDHDDDSPLNPEPHPDDMDWMSDPYGDSSAETSDQADSSTLDSSSEIFGSDEGQALEEGSAEESVEYNLYGAETEGADPSGVYGVESEPEDDFDLTGGFDGGEGTQTIEEEKPLDG